MVDDFVTIQEVKREEFELTLSLGKSATECRMTIHPKQAGVVMDPVRILKLLRQRGITRGVMRKQVVDACDRVNLGHHIHDVVVARGELPKAQRQAQLKFHVKPSSQHPTYEEDADGHIDFHSAHLFENVRHAQTIATFLQAVPAQDGFTVMGNPLPAKEAEAEPEKLDVKLGDGARYGDDGKIISTIDGRVVYDGKQIWVTDVFVVKEDVDFDIGHIDFVGFVQVNGDVVDGFNIRGKKGVRIRHNVGHCRIESDGDVELAGMTGEGGSGQGNSIIRCGNLRAKYLRNVDIECLGDVEIHREAIHCRIRAGGRITCRGSIVGGDCVAFSGIEVGAAGAESGLETELCAGKDFRSVETRKRLMKRIAANEKQQNAIERLVGPYIHGRSMGNMSETFRKKLKKALHQAQKLRTVHDGLRDKLAALNEELTSRKANPKVNIQKVIHRGCVVQLGVTRQKWDDDLRGPITLIEHKGEEIIPTRLTPLDVHARKVESEIVQKEMKEEMAAKKKEAAEAAKRKQPPKPQPKPVDKPKPKPVDEAKE